MAAARRNEAVVRGAMLAKRPGLRALQARLNAASMAVASHNGLKAAAAVVDGRASVGRGLAAALAAAAELDTSRFLPAEPEPVPVGKKGKAARAKTPDPGARAKTPDPNRPKTPAKAGKKKKKAPPGPPPPPPRLAEVVVAALLSAVEPLFLPAVAAETVAEDEDDSNVVAARAGLAATAVRTIAGGLHLPGGLDGPGDHARFEFPRGIAAAPGDGPGGLRLYVADGPVGKGRIRCLQQVSLLAELLH